jgi:hypothetical protein
LVPPAAEGYEWDSHIRSNLNHAFVTG